MKYKFSLKVLLDHRKKLENEARRNFMLAQSRVDDAITELNGFYDQVDRTRTENGDIEKSGGRASPKLMANDDFIAGQKFRIEAQRLKIRELKVIADELMEIMIEAAKEAKTLEKLKERRTDEHKIAERKHELKETDEIVVLRHKREGGMS